MTEELIKANKIVGQFLKLAERKTSISENPYVLERMTPTEQMVLIVGSESAIITIPVETMASEITKCLNRCAQMVGIRGWDHETNIGEHIGISTMLITQHFNQMSIKEIRTAFELSLVGKLDEFLPRDKHGHPDHGHYQEFSAEYVTKILKAFNKYKSRVWSKAYGNLPEMNNKPSEEERAEYKATLMESINIEFNYFAATEKRPRFKYPPLVLKEFKKAGMFDGEIKVTTVDKKAALSRIINGAFLSKYEKSWLMDKSTKERNKDRAILLYANIEAQHRMIYRIFGVMLESGIHPKDILK